MKNKILLFLINRLKNIINFLERFVSSDSKDPDNEALPQIETTDEVPSETDVNINSSEEANTMDESATQNQITINPEDIDFANQILEILSDLCNQISEASSKLSQKNDSISNELITLSQNTQCQNDEMVHGIDAIDTMAKNIDSVSINADQIASAILNATHLIHTGNQSIECLVNQSDIIQKMFESFIATINYLQEESSKIQQVLSMINYLSSETKLLSLNAQIEASRAGESGKGFIVVAKHIKNISIKTTEASKEIEEMLQSIHIEIQRISDRSKLGFEEIRKGNELSYNVKTIFQNIFNIQADINNQMEEICLLNKGNSSNSSELLKTFNHIGESSNKNVSSIAEVSKSCEDQSMILVDIISYVLQVQDMISELKSTLDSFSAPME